MAGTRALHAAADATARAADEWFRSWDGRQAARRWVRMAGLAEHLAEDVAAEVVVRLWRAALGGEEVRDVPALASRIGRFVAVDLARGRGRRPVALDPGSLPDGVDPLDLLEDEDAEPLEVVVGAGLGRAVRATLAGADEPVWVAAAGLALLAVELDGAEPGDACPAPGAGVGPEAVGEWAGLWYAGRDDCFEGSTDAAAPTVRRRRGRAVVAVRAGLARALSLADPEAVAR